MAQDYIERNIDINESIKKITVKQYDSGSRVLYFKFTDKDNPKGKSKSIDLTNHSAKLYCKTPNDELVVVDGEVVDGENGTVSFTLEQSLTEFLGKIIAEVVLEIDEISLSSAIFEIEVIESVRGKADNLITSQATVEETVQIAVTAFNNVFEEV